MAAEPPALLAGTDVYPAWAGLVEPSGAIGEDLERTAGAFQVSALGAEAVTDGARSSSCSAGPNL